MEITTIKLEKLIIGHSAKMKKTITPGAVEDFAKVSEDWGRLHTDSSFARETPFGGCIVHGMLLCGYMSGMINKWLGDEAMVTSYNGKFRAVKVGETVTLQAKVKKIDYKRRFVTVDCSCFVEGNSHSMSKGEALIYVLPDNPRASRILN